MEKYTLMSIAGVIVVFLGLLAFLGGIGEFQAKQQFATDVADDRTRFAEQNATQGYKVCRYNNTTSSLNCPDNPYQDANRWLIGGVLTVIIGLGAIYYDIELT